MICFDQIDTHDTKSAKELNKLYARLNAVRQMEKHIKRLIDREIVRLAREVEHR